ncbi:uncharacterized protein B0P05DRAFT_570822 [Gilbertella persicaria]|nr:uncharacterized protein B0P05DRAFT_570822 [Gilbertella persicaria]KAI8082593.1 hypothetical protein B0P05DRAFT_570822 [Gilbertella persicaria]
MKDDAFLLETTSNTSLVDFIDSVLSEHMDSTGVDTVLLKYIFLLYTRLALLDSTHHPLVNINKLCSFIVVYIESNTNQVQSIVENLVKNNSQLQDSLISTISMLVDTVQGLPNMMAVPVSIDTLDRAYVLLRVLDALILSALFIDTVVCSFDKIDQTLMDCYSSLIPLLKHTVEHNKTTAPYAYLVKKTLVSLFNSFGNIHFFIPLGFVSDSRQSEMVRLKDAEPDVSAIDTLYEKILYYIEQSGLDSSRSAFIDGPLIMDWEVAYDISTKLKFINDTAFDGSEDRLEFLMMSMEQVNGTNDGTGTWDEGLQEDTTEEEEFDDTLLVQKISQIQELFPDLGDGFIEACLAANNNNGDIVVMQLLEDTLPPSVQHLDRSMTRFIQERPKEKSILASRHNIYDNDEFDVFAHRTVDTSKIYEGKKDKGDADTLLDDKSFIQDAKKNVLQRVVDMYDDEYDDTYDDINDAGVPTADVDGDSAVDVLKKRQHIEDPGVQNESLLIHTFVERPDVFNRKSSVRKSKDRAALRRQTGMSHEQIEGWAIMFNRNPRKQRILDKYMLFDGKQEQVSENASQTQQKKPPVSEARDRAYKDKNKARYGNHNRKAGRDKKIAKAGPPPS